MLETEPSEEVPSVYQMALRIPPALRDQIRELSLYDDVVLDEAEIEVESVPWDLSPALCQEPTQNPSHGRGEVAPGTLLHSGEMSQTATDLTIRGRGFDFSLVRTYRNQTLGSGPLGPGWDYSYRAAVSADGRGSNGSASTLVASIEYHDLTNQPTSIRDPAER